MTEPSEEEIATFERVKAYFLEEADKRRYGYLKENDSLFAVGNWTVQVGGMNRFEDPWTRYQEGYYDVAHQAIESMESGLREKWLVYPILFLYRHYLELMLKSILIEASATFHEPIPKGVEGEHNLSNLWETLRTMVDKHRAGPMLKRSDKVSRILAQFTLIDPASMETRYGLKKDLATPSIRHGRDVSLENLQTVMSRMYNELNNLQINFQYAYEAFFQEPVEDDLTKSTT